LTSYQKKIHRLLLGIGASVMGGLLHLRLHVYTKNI